MREDDLKFKVLSVRVGSDVGCSVTYLNVHRARANMANEQIYQPLLPPTETAQYDHSKPRPKGSDSRDLKPPEAAAPARLLGEIGITVDVEIEAGKSEDDVVGPVLVGDHELGEGVEVWRRDMSANTNGGCTATFTNI